MWWLSASPGTPTGPAEPVTLTQHPPPPAGHRPWQPGVVGSSNHQETQGEGEVSEPKPHGEDQGQGQPQGVLSSPRRQPGCVLRAGKVEGL